MWEQEKSTWPLNDSASVSRMIGMTGSRLDPEGLDLYARLVRSPTHVAGALEMMANWDLEAFSRDLPSLTTLLKLMVGDNDHTVPPQQAFVVQQRMAGVEVLRLPGVGHLAHEEQPDLVVRALLAICREYAGAIV